jgi:hypothetical protein
MLQAGRSRPAGKADNLIAIFVPIIYKMWEPRRLTTLWDSRDCYRDSFITIQIHAGVVIKAGVD